MLSESERQARSGGVPVYDFLYELDSTRGRKRILSSVRAHGWALPSRTELMRSTAEHINIVAS